MEKNTFNNGKWQWIRIDPTAGEDGSSLSGLPDTCVEWLSSLSPESNNNLEMETTEEGQEALWGSAIYHQNLEEQHDKAIFHYCLTQDLLVSNLVDFSLLYRLTEQQVMKKLQYAETAIEGFMVLLGETVASFLQDIDAFEDRMHQLLWQLKEKNDESVLDRIIQNRHEIIVWKNLMIPIMEARDALREAFGDSVTDGIHYKRTSRRINRCFEIIDKYDDEIQQMTDLENVLSSYRGNEIFKTLTIITMLFTPLAAWGALWGMNFEIMPELKWQYGYLFAIAVIVLTTIALYTFMRKKNWIGSVLKNPKGKKF